MATQHDESVMMADVEGVNATEQPQRDVIPFVGGLVQALERDGALEELDLPRAES
ncbi:hypothetical protein KLP28_02320 [Nocardioidaceae bacterium]|nr:hypothetical protein KLP28_02320 [Nocardioidaceae bacterium]